MADEDIIDTETELSGSNQPQPDGAIEDPEQPTEDPHPEEGGETHPDDVEVPEEPEEPATPYYVDFTIRVRYPDGRPDWTWEYNGSVPWGANREQFAYAIQKGSGDIQTFLLSEVTLDAVYGGEQVDEQEVRRREYDAYVQQLQRQLEDLLKAKCQQLGLE